MLQIKNKLQTRQHALIFY